MVFIRCNFSLLFIKDLFSEFSLNEFLMNSYEPLVRFSNRIFRVALLFICQCSVFIICFTLLGATLLEYHKSAFPVKHFFKLFCFIIHFHVWNQNRLLSLYLFASATKDILPLYPTYVNRKLHFFYLLKLPTHELTFAHWKTLYYRQYFIDLCLRNETLKNS